jgi:hypothetical protein
MAKRTKKEIKTHTTETNHQNSKKSIDKKQSKQVMWAIILMLAIILIVLFVPSIWKNYANKFVYIDLDFQKTQLGKIFFYSTRVPTTDMKGQINGAYAINFRKDPRQLESIPVNLSKGIITFRKDNTVYISLNPNMKSCEDNTLAFINLAGFLRDFAGLKIKSAVSDKKYGEENSILYADCKSSQNNTVIFITSGEETKITQTSENCYELTYKNCEVLDVSEKFMVEILDNYMNYFIRK